MFCICKKEKMKIIIQCIYNTYIFTLQESHSIIILTIYNVLIYFINKFTSILFFQTKNLPIKTAKTTQILLGIFCHSCGRFSTSNIIQIANTILNFFGSNTQMDELNYYFYKIAFFIIFVNNLFLFGFCWWYNRTKSREAHKSRICTGLVLFI